MRKIFITFISIFAFSQSVFATCPLLDLIEHQGKTYGLAQWTYTPSNEKVSNWIRNLPWCSAIGQGRAVYSVKEGKVFLVKFRGCGSELPVSEAFSQAEPTLLAIWLTGKIDVAKGNCNGGWDPATEYFVVDKGQLVKFHQSQ